MKLVLIGLRGTGKTTVGRMLAGRLNWPFRDTDALVQERAGLSIRELFEQRGEAGFRKLEAEVVRECARENKVVLATGGGAILNPDNTAALKRDGFVVHLTAEPTELWRRVCRDRGTAATRPVLLPGAKSGAEELRELMRSRAAAYAQARDVEVLTDGRAPAEVAEAVLVLLRAHGVMPQD